jgi:allantoate deiminase
VTYAQTAIDICRRIARYSEEEGLTTRPFLCRSARRVIDDLSQWMTRLGMDVRVDSAGNLRGRHAADRPNARCLFIGSHLDTVPDAGAFDGVLGVVLGVTLIEMLDGRRLPFAIEVLGFSEEEGVRFGLPFIGSRAFTGSLNREILQRRDAPGNTVADAIRAFGLDPTRVDEARATDALGYFEMHIEQGPVLDQRGLPLAIVDAIVGQTRADVIFTGAAGHAGTTPMTARRDAVAGAAEWITEVEREARQTPGLVATVGRIEAQPGATNVIAGRCRASVDVRHVDDGVRHAAVARLTEHARRIAGGRSLDFSWDTRVDQTAVRMDPALVSRLEGAVHRCGLTAPLLASGAGHDAMIAAGAMPAAMLFIRSPRGISHHPDESVDAPDVAAALRVGLAFLEELAGV